MIPRRTEPDIPEGEKFWFRKNPRNVPPSIHWRAPRPLSTHRLVMSRSVATMTKLAGMIVSNIVLRRRTAGGRVIGVR